MNLLQINENINRLLSNLWSILGFFKEYLVDPSKDVDMTFINADGTETTNTFPNIAKQVSDGGLIPILVSWTVGVDDICRGSNGKFYYPNKNGDPAGNDPTQKTSDDDWYGEFGTLVEAIQSGDGEGRDGQLVQDITVTVTGTAEGDFPSITKAIEFLSTNYGATASKADGNTYSATINLLAGFIMKEQVLIQNEDLSWITLIGEDAQTTIERAFLTNDTSAGDDTLLRYSAFQVNNGGLININQLFHMDETGGETDPSGNIDEGIDERIGIFIWGNSHGHIHRGAGIKNCKGRHACGARHGSRIKAIGAIFTSSKHIGLYASDSSTCDADECDVSNSYIGVFSHKSSVMNIDYLTANYCTKYGVHSKHSRIRFRHGHATHCKWGIYGLGSGEITADLADASNCEIGIVASGAHSIDFSDSDAIACTLKTVFCEKGGHVGAVASRLRRLGFDDVDDVVVAFGGTIVATDIVGGINQASNVVTANGIIFR